ncbi:MAG: bacteriohemerythrin [Azoarcus sp.]|jgi:hemerythrin|nr:bacteriohemerythrin [Azoarcus sp.]
MKNALFIKWQECNETGIPIIDEQHRCIVSIINSFHYLAERGAGDSSLYLLIGDALKTYIRIHFITEERILEAAKYPDLEKHRELHKKLTQDTGRIEYSAVQENDSRELFSFLKKWWLGHINQEDMQYMPHLNEYAKTHGPC